MADLAPDPTSPAPPPQRPPPCSRSSRAPRDMPKAWNRRAAPREICLDLAEDRVDARLERRTPEVVMVGDEEPPPLGTEDYRDRTGPQELDRRVRLERAEQILLIEDSDNADRDLRRARPNPAPCRSFSSAFHVVRISTMLAWSWRTWLRESIIIPRVSMRSELMRIHRGKTDV
jgi:hypothetical protein